MVTIEIICNVESLYNWLSTKKLSDGNDVVFIDGFDGNEGACCTILSKDGQYAIYHGESTKFVKHGRKLWTSVPSAINSSTVTVTEEELNILKKW